MKDRDLISTMRVQMHEMREQLVELKLRLPPGSRSASAYRAREILLEAQRELTHILGGLLEGDGASAPLPAPALHPDRHALQAGAR